MQVALTMVSRNVKTGPIPVSTTTAKSCPANCPLVNNGCYGAGGPVAIHWRKVTEEKVGKRVTLDSGGWRTVTTKRKMNQAANQFGLIYSVFQRKGQWFVALVGNTVVPFVDGMQFTIA